MKNLFILVILASLPLSLTARADYYSVEDQEAAALAKVLKYAGVQTTLTIDDDEESRLILKKLNCTQTLGRDHLPTFECKFGDHQTAIADERVALMLYSSFVSVGVVPAVEESVQTVSVELTRCTHSVGYGYDCSIYSTAEDLHDSDQED